MAQSVLVPMDHSPPSKAAIEHALTTYPDAQVTVLHVIEPSVTGSYGEAVAIQADDAWAEKVFDAAQQIAGHLGGGFELSTATERGSAARTICEFAEGHRVDHIVMGSHGRSGVKLLLIGSVAMSVVRRADVPVTVVPATGGVGEPR